MKIHLMAILTDGLGCISPKSKGRTMTFTFDTSTWHYPEIPHKAFHEVERIDVDSEKDSFYL
jgi:hypothetical protein